MLDVDVVALLLLLYPQQIDNVVLQVFQVAVPLLVYLTLLINDIYEDTDLVELLEPGYVIVASREVDVFIATLVLDAGSG
jgi:hypothetical protein